MTEFWAQFKKSNIIFGGCTIILVGAAAYLWATHSEPPATLIGLVTFFAGWWLRGKDNAETIDVVTNACGK